MSNGIDLERINWGNYDLIVIDESHNFRNAVMWMMMMTWISWRMVKRRRKTAISD